MAKLVHLGVTRAEDISIHGAHGRAQVKSGYVTFARKRQRVCAIILLFLTVIYHNLVPLEYFATLEVSGQRVDHASRPELNHGTIDFIVPKEYWAQPPPPRLLSSADDPVTSPSKATFLPNLQHPPPPSRKPTPLHVLFAIDVSAESVSSGLTQSMCAVLKQCIFAADSELVVKNIGIIAYDAKAVYFFDLSVRTLLYSYNVIQRLALMTAFLQCSRP